MTLDGSLSFASVIEEHLALKRRNTTLETEMPLDRYRNEDPFQNHPLFKSEEQARLEDTISNPQLLELDRDLVLAGPVADETDPLLHRQSDLEDTIWGRSREFDWGD